MGIATDIVVQHRARESTRKGGRAANNNPPWRDEFGEDELEAARDGVRKLLYHEVPKAKNRDRKMKKDALHALTTGSVGFNESASSNAALLSGEGTQPGCLPMQQGNRIMPIPTEEQVRMAGTVTRHGKIEAQPMRRGTPAFNSPTWRVSHGVMCLRLKAPEGGTEEGRGGDQRPKGVPPPTPAPVRLKRGMAALRQSRRTLALAYAADGRRVLLSDSESNVWLACTTTGKRLCTFPAVCNGRAQSCSISADGSLVAAGFSNGQVALWDCRGKKPSMLLGQTDAEAIHRETKVKGVSYGVSAVEISADARYLASIGEDGKLAVMFLGEELLNGGGSGAGSGENGDHPKSDTPQPRTWLCLDPDSADGSKDSTELSPTHDAALHHLVIGRGSEVLVAVGSRGRVVLVELPTRRVHEFSVGDDHTLLFSALDQVPRDNSSARLAVASTQGELHMYLLQDIFDKKFRPRHTFYMPGGAATCVAFMLCTHGQNHCTRLAAGSEEGMLMIFDVDRGHQLTALNVCAFGTETVHTVQYSSDSRFLLVSGLGPKVLVLDANTNALLYTLIPPVENEAGQPGNMVAGFSPDSCHIAVGLDHMANGGALVWDITPGSGSVLLQRDDDEEEMNYKPFACFTGSERDVLCSSVGGHLQIWNSYDCELAHHVMLVGLADHGPAKHWEYSARCGRVMVGMDDDTVMVFDLEDMREAPNPTFPMLTPKCEFHWPGSRVQMSPSGKMLIRYGRRQAELFSVEGRHSLGQLSTSSSKDFHCFTFSEDGNVLLGSCITCPRIEMWSLNPSADPPVTYLCSLEPLDSDNYTMLPEPSCFMECSVISCPRGNSPSTDPAGGWWVAAVASPTSTDGDAAGGVYWWAVVTPTPRQVKSTALAYHPGHCPNSCVFSPYGRLLGTYGADGMVVLWELKARGKNPRCLGNRVLYPGGVESIAWSTDGSMVATCGDPGEHQPEEVAHVWNAVNGQLLVKLPARPLCHFSMFSFSDDNKAIAAAYTDGKVVVYTRAGASDVMPTDFDFWYSEDVEEGGSYHTRELLEVLQRFPLVANHMDHNGHNLLTALVHLRDGKTLEGVLNLMPKGLPVYSLFGGQWKAGTFHVRNTLDMALSNQDQGILYDLLMAVADTKVTPQSWELLMGGREEEEGVTCWQRLCAAHPNLVLVFLTRLEPEVIDDAVDCVDATGRLIGADNRQCVVGSSVYLPQDVDAFWNAKLAGIGPSMHKRVASACHRLFWNTLLRRPLDPPNTLPHKCVASRVGIPWVLRPRENGLLQPLVESDCDLAVFGTPLVRAVLQYKWKAFGLAGFQRDCWLHLFQLSTFTGFALLLQEEERYPCPYNEYYIGPPPDFISRILNDPKIMIAIILECVSAVLAMVNMTRELRQMRATGIIKYFMDDAWNPLDFVSYLLIFCILPLNIWAEPSCPPDSPSNVLNASFRVPWLSELIALEVVFLWMEVLHYAVGFRSTGGIVRIFQQIIIDIRWFMALQVVLMLGFGAAFAVIFAGQLPCDPELHDNCRYNVAYSSLTYSFTSMIGLLLGDITVLEFFNSPLPFWSVMFMIAYEFLVFVVLFNMLIALMADTFVKVKESEELQFMRGRAGIICSMEDVMPNKMANRFKLFPRYLHIVQMVEDGEFKAALNSIQGQANETRLQLFKLSDSIQQKHKEMLREFRRETKTIKSDMSSLLHSRSKKARGSGMGHNHHGTSDRHIQANASAGGGGG